MAFPVFAIIRTLAPLIADAGRIAVSMRGAGAAKIEDRVGRLEQETIRAGEVLKGVAEQLQALAEQLRVQAEATEALRKKTQTLLIVSVAALCTGVGALAVAMLR